MDAKDHNEESSGDPPSEQITKPGKRRGRRIVIGILLATAIIAMVQHWAPSTDHQIANLITIVIVLITTVQFIWNLHWIAVKQRKIWQVPASCLLIGAIATALFDFEGFSGELIPQIRLTLGKRAPDLRQEIAAQDPAEKDETNTNSPDEASVSPSSDADRSVALSDFPGFLGPQRNGVISNRQFSVPTDASQIETLWNIGIGEGWASFAVVQDRAITLEQREEKEYLSCYRLADGALLWMIQHESFHDDTFGGPGPRSTPSIHENHVYAQGQDGTVWCVDWESGKIIWQVELLELAGWDKEASESAISWARSGSPLLVDDLCVVPFGGPKDLANSGRSLVALNKEDGAVQWTAGPDQISYASPMLLNLAGKRQIVSVNERTITGHQIEDGEELWSFPWIGQSNGGANCASVIAAGADQFLIGKGYGGGSALVKITTAENGSQSAEPLWTSSRVLKTKFTHACVDGRIAYAINNGSLESVNIPEGISNWTQPRRDRLGQGQLLLVDDTLIGQAESGEIVFVQADSDEYRELLRLPAMESKTWNIPTIAGRHLLVRNDREAFYFLLPKRRD